MKKLTYLLVNHYTFSQRDYENLITDGNNPVYFSKNSHKKTNKRKRK